MQKTDIPARVRAYMEAHQMVQPGQQVVVGLSGGADSVCLLTVLTRIRASQKTPFQLLAVHVHHGIRGAEADRDAEFCERLCETLGIPFTCVHRDIPAEAKAHHLSLEEAGRLARREILEAAAGEDGRIALAHHRNDAAETVLLNLCRGTGIRGLSSLRPVRGAYIRPLLFLAREEIRDYLRAGQISWCEDRTNAEEAAARNRIRLHVLPYLESEINPGSIRHLAEAAEHAQELTDFLDGEVQKREAKYVLPARQVYPELTEGVLLSEALLREPAVIRRELIRRQIAALAGTAKDIGAAHIRETEALFAGSAGRACSLPYGLQAFRTGTGVILAHVRTQSADSEASVPLAIPGTTVFSGYRIETEILAEAPSPVPEKRYTKWLDYDKISVIPVLRTRCTGDSLIYGKDGSRKALRRLFIDEKVPSEARDRIPVLAVGSRVIWAVGVRMSADVYITETTRRVLKLTAVRTDLPEAAAEGTGEGCLAENSAEGIGEGGK